jgi:2-oxoglutarate dehydrogenase E1 component
MQDNINASNANYIDALYRLWQKEPRQVPSQWASHFQNSEKPSSMITAIRPRKEEDQEHISIAYKQSRVDSLIWAYRDIGYIFADLNPLGNYRTPEMEYMYITMRGNFQNLELSEFDLSEEDLDTEFHAGRTFDPPRATLREILRKLKKIYASHMGVEFLHIQNKVMRQWLIRNIESADRKWPKEAKISVQENLIKANTFESFIHSNFIGQKRFSLEGAEVLVPALQYLFRAVPQHNIQEIVMGMTHRGRLNILINSIGKPASEIFSTFLHNYKPHEYGGSGDVRYHLGQSFDYIDKQNASSLHITLVSNPSHLESVNPVVEGKARGVQLRRGDINRKKVLPVLIHGDAAFSGQGVVAETFNLSQLRGFRTGGTLHIIINNQIGFTTASRDARSTFFATDIAKTIQIPIFHVNGDDPEAVIQAIDFALRWRQKFGYDAVIDIFCYRKLGHNETDEPSFTHPIMYKLIKAHPGVTELYGEKLEQEGVYSEAKQNKFKAQYIAALKKELERAKKSDGFAVNDAFKRGVWKEFTSEYSFSVPETGVKKESLNKVLKALTKVPEGFELHPKLQRFVSERKKSFASGKSIDWSLAEALSFGSLLLEGHSIRLSGEDSSRGTFSQRHAQWWDVKSPVPKPYVPLNHIDKKQGQFSVFDSPLSEFSVLGFEYGHSISQPNTLILFEAQFGDFVNGAQVIIDQYIAAGESKWFRASNIVMLLPHGYEGQGPEHSSAYLERFLQLCAKENLQVCNLTTPAQYFHLLRKQMKQKYRKPLIIMSPKSLLRNKMAASTVEELLKGKFEMVLGDRAHGLTKSDKTENLLLCSGKIYYDLINALNNKKSKHTSIIRIEQLYPFPQKMLKKIFQEAGKPKRVMWVQEEPRNRGAWGYIKDRIRSIASQEVEYVGREPSPSPATGSHIEHEEELKAILHKAIPDG